MKLFTSTENMYFKMVTNRVRVKQEFIQVQFEMTAIPRRTFDLRFNDLAQLIKGEVSSKVDKKVRRKVEDILIATQNFHHKEYEIASHATETIKLRMNINTRFKNGDEIIIQPDMDLPVKIKEKTSKLVHENAHTRVLVTHVKVTNNSKNIIRLKN